MFPSTTTSQSNNLCTETVFGRSSRMPNYGGTSTWASDQSSSPLFSTTTFGVPSNFGFTSFMTASGHSSSSKFGSSPVFIQGNQNKDSFASNSHGTSTWNFSQTSSPLFSKTTFSAPSTIGLGGSSFGGSRITGYTRTAEAGSNKEKLVSISAMPTYEAKSHEELRWEDYNLTHKGGFGLSSSSVQSKSPFAGISTSSWGNTAISTTVAKPNPFKETLPPVATEGTTFNFPSPTHIPTWKYPWPSTSTSFTSPAIHFPPPVTPSTSFNSFAPRTTTPTATSLISFEPLTYNPTAKSSTSTFCQISSSSLSSPTFSAFTSSLASTSPSWKYPGPTTSTSFTSPTIHFPLPATPSTSFNPFVPRTTTPTTAPVISFEPLAYNLIATSSTSTVSPTSSSSFFSPTSSSSFFSPTSLAFISSSASTSPSLNAFWPTPVSGPFASTVTTPTTNSISVSPVKSWLSSNLNEATTLCKPCVPSTQNCNGTTTGVILDKSTSTEQPSSVANPFGTLPPKPQIFFEGSPSTQTIQYGISSIPVRYNPAPVRNSLLTTRHLSRRNKQLPVRKYDPKLNGPKIPYFSDTEEIPVATFVPRENPRSLGVSSEMWSPRGITGIIHEEKFSDGIYEKESDEIKANSSSDAPSKLVQPDYYTVPPISELEAKEKTEQGFCRHVKDFVVGRHGYGSIKFLGETDVRNLDIETHIQFNYREVIVYMDDTKKPPVGEGLNKPAEITLLNIKCINKKTGMQYIQGSNIDKYTQMLKKKAVAQGAEFMSYDPIGGEWKFRVEHF